MTPRAVPSGWQQTPGSSNKTWTKPEQNLEMTAQGTHATVRWASANFHEPLVIPCNGWLSPYKFDISLIINMPFYLWLGSSRRFTLLMCIIHATNVGGSACTNTHHSALSRGCWFIGIWVNTSHNSLCIIVLCVPTFVTSVGLYLPLVWAKSPICISSKKDITLGQQLQVIIHLSIVCMYRNP